MTRDQKKLILKELRPLKGKRAKVDKLQQLAEDLERGSAMKINLQGLLGGLTTKMGIK